MVSVICLATLSGCTVPRGAASLAGLKGGVVELEGAPRFTPVTRASVAELNRTALAAGPARSWPHNVATLEMDVRIGDQVEVIVWDSDPSSLIMTAGQRSVALPAMRVDSAGGINLPYGGQVLIAGLSLEVARTQITNALRERVPTAELQINFAAGPNNMVHVVEGVSRPGQYPLQIESNHVLSTLSAAGGIAPSLTNPVVRVVRGGQVYEVAASALLDGSVGDIPLRGGDRLIIVQDPRRFTAIGATSAERVINFDRQEVTAIEALAMASGLLDQRADPKSILVLRSHMTESSSEAADILYTIDLTSADGLFAARRFLIQDGDTFLATEAPLSATRTVLELIGSMVGISNGLRG
jgi:polysaccharide biosynthesis/export protein